MNGMGWKLFEVGPHYEPRTLVHGLAYHASGYGGMRTRNFVVNKVYYKDWGTKGFNYFASFKDLRDYLPRFRVRASRLAACCVHVENYHMPDGRSAYMLAERILIPKVCWDNRLCGVDLL